MPPQQEDDLSSLERARERLYRPAQATDERHSTVTPRSSSLPHAWKEALLPPTLVGSHRHVRLASLFFGAALIFFIFSLGIAAYVFTVGGNSVSVDKVTLDMQGPTTIAGGDTVPLSLTVTNRNSVAIQNATIDIAFPPGTRSATDVLQNYPRYSENVGELASGASVTRSVRAVIFGGVGQTITIPVTFSYGAAGSNAVFTKKSSAVINISTTPLSIAVDTLSEAVSGQPFTITLTVRSNATVPLQNVVVSGAFPFGYQVTSSSLPVNNSSFLVGTLKPGAVKEISLVGVLTGQDSEQRVFHFTVGTASTPQDQTLAVTYMTQDASLTITAPFINTTLALNGDTSPNVIVTPGAQQNVSLSYTNTLATSITNATVAITLSGSAVDYNSIQTQNGFYRSTDHTILFSRDTDPSLAQLAPGASGVGTFTFSTLPLSAHTASPTITFTTSVSGTRVGQSNVPEQITSSVSRTAKVATVVTLSAAALHSSGAVATSGPIPPRAGQATTYAISWSASNGGSSIAGASVQAILPSYVTYTNLSTGAGGFSYDDGSRTVTWNIGDLAQGASAQGTFQVSITPSTSQKGSAPVLADQATFSGYDRFAGVQVSATADSVTTETKGDPGYVPPNAIVQ